ncbi:MAG: dihydroorotase [Candidatus Thermoplasmatota archaeon]|nr:dihydroorotase [Candidatus Thermoplasmatota archaeon]
MDMILEGKAFVNGSFEHCCIGISNGKILSIKKILKGDQHLIFKNKLLLPAAIDIHVHFRDPGMTAKEDFATGSLAAAYGGTSCVCDMPNTLPATTTIQDIIKKKTLANRKSFVDFGVYAGITDANSNSLSSLAQHCNGFKIYLGSSTNALLLPPNKLMDVFYQASKVKKPLFIHAEDESCLLNHKKVEHTLADHLQGRPAVCEEQAIQKILTASSSFLTPIHICHLSSCEGLELLKKRPTHITCGVTPHHTLLNAEQHFPSQSCYKVNPPLRTRLDKESLFDALAHDTIDILESDHAPHTLEEKQQEFDAAPSGVPGVETMVPLFLYLTKKQQLSFQQMTSLLCARPGEILAVPKGKLQPGYDADIMVVDLKKETKITADMLHSKCGWTPFEKFPAIFPLHLFIRGEKLIEDREIQVSRGFGQYIGE